MGSASHERPLSGALDVAGQEDAASGAFDPDHARVGVGEARAPVERVQDLERYAVPHPVESHGALGVRAVGPDRAVRGHRRDDDGLGQTPVPPDVVRVPMAQHDTIDRAVTSTREKRQHRQSGSIEVAPDRRSGVVDQHPLLRLHHHREPVPHVEHRHPVAARADRRHRPHRDQRQHPGDTQPAAHQATRSEQDRHPERGGGELPRPDRARGAQHRGVRADPVEGRPQSVEHDGRGRKERGADARQHGAGEQTQQDHRDHDRADQRNDHGVDERGHQGLLGEDAQRHRREPHGDRNLHDPQGAQSACERTSLDRRPGGERRHDDRDGDKGQPEPRGANTVRIEREDRDEGERKRVGGQDAPPRQPRAEHHREHQQRALGGQGESGEQRVGERGEQRRDPRDLRRRDRQRRSRHDGPRAEHHPVGGAGRHPDMQPGDRHEMGDSGHAQRPPALLRDTASIADGECADQSFTAVAIERGTNGPRQLGPQRVHPCRRQRGCRADAPPRFDVAGGGNVVGEQPAFVVRAAGIVPSARPSQPHRQAPHRPRRRHHMRAVPRERHPGTGRYRAVSAVLDVESESRSARVGPRQAAHDADDLHVPPLHRGRQRFAHLDVGKECRPCVSRHDRQHGTGPDLRHREAHRNGQRRTPHRIRQRRPVLEQRHPDCERAGERQHVYVATD